MTLPTLGEHRQPGSPAVESLNRLALLRGLHQDLPCGWHLMMNATHDAAVLE